MKLPHKVHIRVNTDLNSLADILAWFDQFNQAPVPSSVWLQCQLALAEGFTNAVRHAHAHLPLETPIDIEVTVAKEALELRIWDYGIGFDLEKRLENLPPTVDHDAEGGRGLKLIEQTADILSYDQGADQRNCLLIIKNYNERGRRIDR